jgi:hypothetical protein
VRVALATTLVLAALLGSACSGGGGNPKAFCDSLRSGDNPLDVFDRYDPTNLATARDQLQRGVDRMKQLEQAAPSEIHGDMQVLVDVGSKVVGALDPAAGSTAAPDFSADAQRVTDASAAVRTFASTHCGIDLDSASPGPVSPGS